ncbi:MAG: hypothetical protein C0390_12780 [Syntrophus sp. (in: bacteria)]|nr:hypothetical protein [Syntrophus sp. (in: bacteria)]
MRRQPIQRGRYCAISSLRLRKPRSPPAASSSIPVRHRVRVRDDPHKYPHLLIRVSGYSAYFNDLAPAMKEEIISRTVIASVR